MKAFRIVVESILDKRRCGRGYVGAPLLLVGASYQRIDGWMGWMGMADLMECAGRVGKDCVAIACDLRLGMQALTVSNDFPKIFNYGDVYLGLTGLATDVTTVYVFFPPRVCPDLELMRMGGVCVAGPRCSATRSTCTGSARSVISSPRQWRTWCRRRCTRSALGRTLSAR